jgi:hypothetical protein
MGLAEHVAHLGEKRNICRVFVGKLEGRGLLGRARCSWVVILKWILKEWNWKEMG